MRAAVVFAVLACSALALTAQNDPFWATYKKQFSKKYANMEEEEQHYAIFLKNMARATELNEIDSATHGWTRFTDEERVLKPLALPAYQHRTYLSVPNGLPTSFDWRDKGAVTPVKDQRQCGSCWAFCTVVSFEGAYFLEHGKLLSLSEQQLVDCDTDDHGCNGGWPTTAMEYIQNHGGSMLESDYPYTGSKGMCRFSPSKAKMQVDKVYTFAARDEQQMMTALQQHGPLAVAVDASKFNSYIGGIMNDQGCNDYLPNHGVAVVGWGVENGTKYWIIKNSWGEDWGEKGYIRLLRGVNACGVEENPMGVKAR